jgi:hypothetical protein
MKIRSRKQWTDIGKYSFVNGTIQLWNQLPEDALWTLSCKPSSFKKRVRCGKWSEVKRSKVEWSGVE